MESLAVVPVNPGKRRELDVFDRLPRSLPGSSDQLGLVQAVGRLGERVDAPIDQVEAPDPSHKGVWISFRGPIHRLVFYGARSCRPSEAILGDGFQAVAAQVALNAPTRAR